MALDDDDKISVGRLPKMKVFMAEVRTVILHENTSKETTVSRSFDEVWAYIRTRHTQQRKDEVETCNTLAKTQNYTKKQLGTLSNRFQLFLPNGFIKLLQPFIAFTGRQTGSVLNGQAAPNTFRCLCCLLPPAFTLDLEEGFAAVVPNWVRPLHETVNLMMGAIMNHVYTKDDLEVNVGCELRYMETYDDMMEKTIAKKKNIYELPVTRERVKNIRMHGDFWRWANCRFGDMAKYGLARFIPGPEGSEEPLMEMIKYLEEIVNARKKKSSNSKATAAIGKRARSPSLGVQKSRSRKRRKL